MAEFRNLKLSTTDNILTITLDRASKLNALDQATLSELREVVQTLYDETDIKGVIITGDGEKAFAAGADISELMELNELNARKFAENGQEIFREIEECHVPIVAVISGFALGGGCELAMATHIRIATTSAKFGQPEVNLGVIPGYGGTQRLTQLIGKGRALEHMMTGDTISADSAKKWGLVNHVVETKAEAIELAHLMLKKIAAKAPVAIELVVDCVNAVYNTEVNGYQTEANAFAKCCGTEDFKEGTSAFLDKRTAEFKGA